MTTTVSKDVGIWSILGHFVDVDRSINDLGFSHAPPRLPVWSTSQSRQVIPPQRHRFQLYRPLVSDRLIWCARNQKDKESEAIARRTRESGKD
jgi:hypothetical protein